MIAGTGGLPDAATGGEHPRVVYRKDEIPSLKQRAATPEGKIILDRLRYQIGKVENFFSAAGHCFLYQLTDDAAEAAAARATVDKALALQLETVGRFKWSTSTQTIDYGPATRGIAMAYDMCYGAWPADYRQNVAAQIADHVDKLIAGGGPGYNANSNSSNWNPITHGSAAVAAMAIMGDPGVPDQAANLATLKGRIDNYLNDGIGDHGWGKEGQNYKRFACFEGLFPYFHANRRALGKDVVTGNIGAEWLVPLWAMEIVPRAGAPSIPHRGPDHGYGDRFDTDGHFAEGFSSVSDAVKPAILWVYNHFVDPPAGQKFDTGVNWDDLSQSAIYSLVNWPFGLQERSPNGILPHIVQDSRRGFYVFRNRWQDENDIIVSINFNSIKVGPSWSTKDSLGVKIWGLGMNTDAVGPVDTDDFPVATGYFGAKDDGSQGVVSGTSSTQDRALGVDFSGTSGTPALIAIVDRKHDHFPFTKATAVSGNTFTISGPGGASLKGTVVAPAGATVTADTNVTGGTEYFIIITLQPGAAPAVNVQGTGLSATATVGGQTVSFDGTKIVFGK